jgi:hypothetical protein
MKDCFGVCQIRYIGLCPRRTLSLFGKESSVPQRTRRSPAAISRRNIIYLHNFSHQSPEPLLLAMERDEVVESPRKRLKVADSSAQEGSLTPSISSGAAVLEVSTKDATALKEAEVGITEFVSSGLPGFSGILKKRFVKKNNLVMNT